MKRLLIVLAAVLSLVVASCGSSGVTGGTAAAATVNGTDIATETLMSELAGYASNTAFVSSYQEQGGAVNGATEGSYDPVFTAAVLSTLIVSDLIDEELEKRGLEVTPADEEAARTSFQEQFGEGATTMPQDFQDRQVQALASRAVLTAALQAESPTGEPTDEDARAYYDENINAIMEQNGDFACASHILVAFDPNADPAVEPAAPTADQEAAALATANALEARLAAGEDFGAIAAAESADPGSAAENGDLGCKPAGSGYVEEFETALFSQPVGEVGPPVKTQFGYHIILVRSRGVVPFEEVKDDIKQGIAEQQSGDDTAVSTWLQQAVKDAEVTIDPRYGTWDVEKLVVPPEGASTQTTVAPEPLPGEVLPTDSLVVEGG